MGIKVNCASNKVAAKEHLQNVIHMFLVNTAQTVHSISPFLLIRLLPSP